MSLQIVQRVRAKYRTPLAADHGRFLLEVATALGKGLVKKNWGVFVRLPDGTGVSQDCVMDPNGMHWDILADGENSADPAWQLVEDEAHAGQPLILPFDRFYPVAAAATQVQAPPPPLDLSPVLEKLATLEAQIAALKVTVEDVRSRTFPEYTTRFLGQTLTLKPSKQVDFDYFIRLIRRDNARYAEALEALLDIAQSSADGPPVEREARRTPAAAGDAPDGDAA